MKSEEGFHARYILWETSQETTLEIEVLGVISTEISEQTEIMRELLTNIPEEGNVEFPGETLEESLRV